LWFGFLAIPKPTRGSVYFIEKSRFDRDPRAVI
jgi:hypothetical protein